jgi:tetratricopeptide (TPR) repeat protein
MITKCPSAISFRSSPAILLCAVVALCCCSGSPERRGGQCLDMGDFENALTFYSRAVHNQPTSYRARAGLAKAWLQYCCAPENGRRLTPDDWHKAVRYSLFAFRLRQTEDMKDALSMCQFRLARALSASGDSAGALSSAMESIRIRPLKPPFLNYAGILNHKAGKDSVARELFLRAQVLDSTDAVAPFNLGMLHWYKGEFLQAHHYWLRALKIAPRDQNVVYWFAAADVKVRTLK